jgi:hypothetical protein
LTTARRVEAIASPCWLPEFKYLEKVVKAQQAQIGSLQAKVNTFLPPFVAPVLSSIYSGNGIPGWEGSSSADALAAVREDLAYHQMRVLLLVARVAATPGHQRKLHGLTTLAKLDFLVRYPALAPRSVLDEVYAPTAGEFLPGPSWRRQLSVAALRSSTVSSSPRTVGTRCEPGSRSEAISSFGGNLKLPRPIKGLAMFCCQPDCSP